MSQVLLTPSLKQTQLFNSVSDQAGFATDAQHIQSLSSKCSKHADYLTVRLS